MAFHASGVAADDDGFGGNGSGPALGFSHQGATHTAPAVPGRNHQSGDFHAKSRFNDLRGVGLQPASDVALRIIGDKHQIGIRTHDGVQSCCYH